MPHFKAIIFDYGGVIYGVPNTRGTGLFEALCAELDIDIEELKALYFANNHRNNIQNWSHKQTLLFVLASLAPSKLTEAEKLIDQFMERRALNQALLGYIKKIKAHGYTVALLSNYNHTLRDLIAENGVAEIFEENIFISTEIGYQKPNPKIFEHTFERLGIRPEEVIFIDDSATSLSTAETVGYHPIRFLDNEQLVADLQRAGIQV